MNLFFKLNTSKLIVNFVLGFVIFSALFSIISFFGYRAGQFGLTEVLISSVWAPSVIAALAVIGTIYIWFANFKKRKEIFIIPTLEQIGFRDCYFHERSVFTIAEQSKAIKINGYTLLINVPEPKEQLKGVLQFVPLVTKKKLSRKQLNQLQQNYGISTVPSLLRQFRRLYRVEAIKAMTSDNLKEELLDFVNVLKNEGFEPDESAVRWL